MTIQRPRRRIGRLRCGEVVAISAVASATRTAGYRVGGPVAVSPSANAEKPPATSAATPAARTVERS